MAPQSSDGGSVSIRPYVPEDKARLVELLRELQSHERDIEPRMKPPECLGGAYFDNQLSEIERYGGAILIAESDGMACGYATYMTHCQNDDEEEVECTYAYVADLAVTAAMRGTGIGRQLLKACEQGARVAGAKVLRISVLSQNESALGLYRSFGFSDRVTELEKPLGT